MRGYPTVRTSSRAARKPEAASTLWDATIPIVETEFSFALDQPL
ncbi:hypothetical protein [Nocardiopsis ansamitocini]|uniref:Uncharacterized protein n=1 Tax=Nocardiopsis ansamitocini TaxID=1670832 RepID=A0A9W6P3K7_9ACTN|nr:hypothetical protein [Nocardiopsis ansamitocini]GLU46461.1 hypothetical protein Nans01_08120 [Nocardiopsis ansamitocini]